MVVPKGVLDRLGRHRRCKLMEFPAQAPDPEGVEIYPAESFPVLGAQGFTQKEI
jgi:hypothetical protein